MANTKKVLEEDFTKAPQAETAEDVNNQDARTRLWQSLNTTYSNQMEESDKAYDKSISQQNNAMLARGMGRSSYAAQISANMYNDKNTARNKLGQALIADYQNRIGEIEAQRDTVADTQWQKQFEYQKGRDTVADRQWQKQYDEQLRQFNENMAYQRERANVSDAQWQKTYDENLRQFNAQMAQQEAQFKANYDFQVSEANRQQSNWEIQQAFNEKQWQAQQEQWKKEFEYSKMSTDQKLAYESIMAIIGQGNDPSDDLLARAGLSRADVNAMKAQAATASASSAPGNIDRRPAWEKAGFGSEDEYNRAKARGYTTKAEWDKYMKELNGGNPGDSDSTKKTWYQKANEGLGATLYTFEKFLGR